MQLAILNQAIKTMTSIDLVDWINRERCQEVNSTLPGGHSNIPSMLRHDNFMAKLEKHPGIDSPKFLGHVETSGPNGASRKSKCYHLPRRECGLMIMSESLLVQTRMYDRLADLEQAPAPAMALPADYIQALESLLASKKSEMLAIEQRDHAIATKAQIGDKRQATAMATASAAKKESAKLRDQLGFNSSYATVTSVQNALHDEFDWLPLRRWCKAQGISPKEVQDKRFGFVKAWPAGAWGDVYGVRLDSLFGEVTA